MNAVLHTVYFGETFEDVNTATGGSPGIELTYDPGPLAKETTYFRRVDEFDGTDTIKGDVWSFTTMTPPPLPPP